MKNTLLVLLVLCRGLAAQEPKVRYVYDESGRLSAVIGATGEAASYEYDAAGNITSIKRLVGPNAAAVFGFSPVSGPAGTEVEILGVGFPSSKDGVTVALGANTAEILEISTIRIKVRLPAAATTNPLSVRLPGGATLRTPRSFTVTEALPEIQRFEPAVVDRGASLRVFGRGFNLPKFGARVQFNHGFSTPSTFAADSFVVTTPPDSTAGKVTVTTNNGSVSSAGDLFVVPTSNLFGGFRASMVEAAKRIQVGESNIFQVTQTNKIGLFLFDAGAGATVMPEFDTASAKGFNLAQVKVSFFSPSGVELKPEGSVTTTLYPGGRVEADDFALNLFAFKLPESGTYSMVLDARAAVGSVPFRLLNRRSALGYAEIGGAPVQVELTNETRAAQINFFCEAGKQIQFDIQQTAGELALLIVNQDLSSGLLQNVSTTQAAFTTPSVRCSIARYSSQYWLYLVQQPSPRGTIRATLHETGTLSPQAPTIAAQNGIVNGGSFLTGVAPDTWMTIYGDNLAGTARSWQSRDFTGTNLPTRLDDVSVTINGRSAYIYYISPKQLNVLVPGNVEIGPAVVEVVNAKGRTGLIKAATQLYSPAFFLSTGTYIAAQHLDYVIVAPSGAFGAGAPSSPAKPGEIVQLYATGLGPTNPAAAEGKLIAAPLALATTPVTVTVGGIPAQVQFAGLVASGLNQVNIRIPDNIPNGDQPVVLSVGGSQSQPGAMLPIQR